MRTKKKQPRNHNSWHKIQQDYFKKYLFLQMFEKEITGTVEVSRGTSNRDVKHKIAGWLLLNVVSITHIDSTSVVIGGYYSKMVGGCYEN